MTADVLHWLQGSSEDAEVSLHFDPDLTRFSCPDASLIVSPGWARLAREYFRAWPPRPVDIENAIATIEDELMRLPRDLRGLHVTSDEQVLREIALAAGLAAKDKRLDRDVVERVFERLSAVALGRPNTQEGLPENPQFASILLILREIIHHLDISSVRLAEDPNNPP